MGIRGTGEKRGKRAKTPSHLRACGETHRVSARAAPAAPGPGAWAQGCKKNDAAARARARARGREAAGREAAGRGAPPRPRRRGWVQGPCVLACGDRRCLSAAVTGSKKKQL